MDGKRCGDCVSKKFLRCAATQKLLRRSIDNGPPGPARCLSRSCLYHICNFDQSPQSVEPVANTTLARKGTGERVVKTRGKEKDRVTAQFRASLDGTKCPSMLIFKGAAAADEVVPCGKRTT